VFKNVRSTIRIKAAAVVFDKPAVFSSVQRCSVPFASGVCVRLTTGRNKKAERAKKQSVGKCVVGAKKESLTSSMRVFIIDCDLNKSQTQSLTTVTHYKSPVHESIPTVS
jgi:hypothetical protein